MPKIILPGGYRPEEGKGPGDEVQALVTLKLLGDGTSADVLDIDGAKFSAEVETGKKEEVVEAEAPADEDSSSEAFGSRLQAAMQGMGQGAGAGMM